MTAESARRRLVAVSTRLRTNAIHLSHNDTIDPIWRAIAGHVDDVGEVDQGKMKALADLISAAGAAALVPGSAEILGAGAIKQARLLNRFRRLQGEKWSGVLNDSGVRAMAMKGLSTAHTVWPDPDARAVSDADLLVASGDLDRAMAVLKSEGFTIADMPTRGPWGFVGDASFQPLIGPGDEANIDLHIQGDAWPFRLALPVTEIMANARLSARSGLWLPDPTHQFLIAASHATGDLLTADSIKSVVDGLLMLRGRIDFGELHRRSTLGHMRKPVTVFLALLAQLGGDCSLAWEAGFDPEKYSGGEFKAVVHAHNQMFLDLPPAGFLGRLKREITLCAETRVVLWRNGRRLTGLVRPRTGHPPGVAR